MFTLLFLAGVAAVYLWHINNGLKSVPDEARLLSPNRWTAEEIKAAYKRAVESPIDTLHGIPPKQNRRYIVVGGSGLVGGWIVSHLLARGEDPTAIRILDLQPPSSPLINQGIAYIKTDIANEASVSYGFSKPWPTHVSHLPLTTFHAAAIITSCERYRDFLPRYKAVNVHGTANVLNTAKESGTSCFLATSSGSISSRRVSFWLPPWRKQPDGMMQVLSDASEVPITHEDFFGNYAVTKSEAERRVRMADDRKSGFRTGCIRPTNGVYGIASDIKASLVGKQIHNGGSPTWISHVIQSFVNAENVSIAHLLYEQRLIELDNSDHSGPDIAGQAFTITDPNLAISFGDMYMLISVLSESPTKFSVVSPIIFFIMADIIESYVLVQHRYLSRLLPKLTGPLYQVQPTLFGISSVFIFGDDSRAKMHPRDGGLGYNPPLTTLEGMCKEVAHWNRTRHERE